ncbi:hypothetical protein FKM82_025705 [Ascaphus truei]
MLLSMFATRFEWGDIFLCNLVKIEYLWYVYVCNWISKFADARHGCGTHSYSVFLSNINKYLLRMPPVLAARLCHKVKVSK